MFSQLYCDSSKTWPPNLSCWKINMDQVYTLWRSHNVCPTLFLQIYMGKVKLQVSLTFWEILLYTLKLHFKISLYSFPNHHISQIFGIFGHIPQGINKRNTDVNFLKDIKELSQDCIFLNFLNLSGNLSLRCSIAFFSTFYDCIGSITGVDVGTNLYGKGDGHLMLS